jgi:hypothetical protein
VEYVVPATVGLGLTITTIVLPAAPIVQNVELMLVMSVMLASSLSLVLAKKYALLSVRAATQLVCALVAAIQDTF